MSKGIFKTKIVERTTPVTVKEAERAIAKISKRTGVRMEVTGGVKRRGWSINDVDIKVYTDKLPRSAKEAEKYGIPLMRKLRIRVDLLFVNSKREKIPIYDYSDFGVGRYVGSKVFDYGIAMFSPSSLIHIVEKDQKTHKGWAYLPTWGYLNKNRVDKVDRLKTEKDYLAREISKIRENYPPERWSVDILAKPPMKFDDPIRKKYFGMRERRRKIREELEKMHVISDAPSEREKVRFKVVERWQKQERKTGKLPKGVSYV